MRRDREVGRSPYGWRCCGDSERSGLFVLPPRRGTLPLLSRMKTPLSTRGSLCLAFPGPLIRGEGAAAAAQSPSVGAANGRNTAVGWRNPGALQKKAAERIPDPLFLTRRPLNSVLPTLRPQPAMPPTRPLGATRAQRWGCRELSPPAASRHGATLRDVGTWDSRHPFPPPL